VDFRVAKLGAHSVRESSAVVYDLSTARHLERAIAGLRQQGQAVDYRLLAHLSPLSWEHINLTGDYVWHANKRVTKGRFRPLRNPKEAMTRLFTPQAAA
jgi:hypothetical protein